MKKLMIAACAVALAVAAQASTYKWQYATSAAINDTDGEKATQTVYLMMGYASTTDANNAKKALLTDLRAGTFNEGNITTFDHYSGQKASLVNGQLATTPFTESKGGTQYAFGVIFDTDSAGAKYAYLTGNGYAVGVDAESGTGAGTLSLMTGNSNIYAIDDTSKTGLQQGWYTIQAADVPEPTSGLLLVLGLAGLALRRRRA